MQCILPQGQTTPERALSNPWFDKGFCEPYQYRAALDRCKGGYESCEMFIDIFAERVRLEREYAASLERWAASSIKQISQSKEFGINKKVWVESIRASKEIGNTHTDIAQEIQEKVVQKMITYKKDNYGKSILHVKKIKEFEREFEQAQKPWLKLLDKINRAKKDYQEAHRQLQKAETAEKIIESDNGAEKEQITKVQLSVSTYKKQCEALKSKYLQNIEEMKSSRTNYENSMKEALQRTHTFERNRLVQFKTLFTAFQVALVIDNDPHLVTMAKAFTESLATHDADKDIQWWNSHFGSDTNTNWPSFEELKD